jgi:GTP cyclohydrolase I
LNGLEVPQNKEFDQMKTVKLTVADIQKQILQWWEHDYPPGWTPRVWGVPRGGWNIAMLMEYMMLAKQVETVDEADVIVDDIIDSGSTRDTYLARYPEKRFWAPYDKTNEDSALPWLVFPWEGSAHQDGKDLVTRMLQFIGEDVSRPGLQGTPDRVVRSWKEIYAGYNSDPKEECKALLSAVFPSDSADMVICRDIEFYSQCEHHMIPFFGSVSIAYIPNGYVVGLSKLARVVEVYARRLQIQEQLGEQIANAIVEHVHGPVGDKTRLRMDGDFTFLQSTGVEDVAVVIKAKHMCMCGRGVGKQNSSMVTSALRGKFRKDQALRAEFLSLLSI